MMVIEEVKFGSFSDGASKNLETKKEEIMKSKITFILALAAMMVFAAGTVWAAILNVDNTVACEDSTGIPSYCTIQAAIDSANSGDTINVAAGTYVEVGQIIIDKNLSIEGADKTTTIIKPAQNTGASSGGSDYRAWIYVTPGTTFNLNSVTLDGTGWDIRRAIVFGKYGPGGGDGIINNIIIRNFFTATTNDGVGIATYGDLTISNSIFLNIRRTPIFIVGDSPVGETSVEVSYNTVIGKGDVTDRLDNGIEVCYGAHANIHHNTVSNCRAFYDPWVSVAIYVHHDASADITYNTIVDNTNGISVGYYNDSSDESTVNANFNNIVGNTQNGVKAQDFLSITANATCNWWGHYTGPSDGGPGTGDAVSSNVIFDPWWALPFGSEFEIDKAKIDFKKEGADDKADVKGQLGQACCSGVSISDDVTVSIGGLSWTIYGDTMEEKGKEGEKWEYKRPKDGDGDIKHMKIDWKKGKFDVHMDKADLSGLTGPNDVSISITIGGYGFGSETITMTVKDSKWEYKAPK